MKVYEVIYHGFDNMENRNPDYSKRVKTFSSAKKAEQYVSEQPKFTYKGYDGKKYPYYSIKERKVE